LIAVSGKTLIKEAWDPKKRITRVPGSSGFSLHLPVILKRVVPHEAHLPLRAWRPFFRVTVFGDEITLVFLSLTQNAFVIG
jgi:hypothetical protein